MAFVSRRFFYHSCIVSPLDSHARRSYKHGCGEWVVNTMDLSPKTIEDVTFRQVRNETLRALGYAMRMTGWR